MQHALAAISLLVNDYDEAIEYYTRVLGFVLAEDRAVAPDKRWVLVAPPGGGSNLLLARAANDAQVAAVGHQSGGRVFLFLHTDDFDASYAHLGEQGVLFTEQPRAEAYGRVVVFLDRYGNKWDLIEPAAAPAQL